MTFGYPVSIQLNNKVCKVVGGGVVAERKVMTLLEQQANVIVVAPEITDKLKSFWEQEKLIWIRKSFEKSDDLDNSFLVIAATNSRQTNHQIATYCNDNNILVNVIDQPQESNFVVNAHFYQGDLMVAVSTSGQSPAVAKKVKNELKKQFGEEYTIWLKILAEARTVAKESIDDDKIRNQRLKQLVDIEVLELIKDGNVEEARKRVMACLSS